MHLFFTGVFRCLWMGSLCHAAVAFVYILQGPQKWGYDLKFELGRDFCILTYPANFTILCLIVQKLSC